MRFFILILSSLFVIQSVKGQENIDEIREKITSNFHTQLTAFPQEKIHVHTDRNRYSPAEKIWFKVYLLDSYLHQQKEQSRYVYVELISPQDSVKNRVMIRPQENLYHGHIDIPEKLPEGTYTLRAYTRYMENLGEDYFFRKKIEIANLLPAADKSEEKPARKRKQREQREEYAVQFFPEGGNLLRGTMNRVAFKSVNEKGYAESISGILINEKGEEITKVETFHNGMGLFSFVPMAGESYSLQCQNEKGYSKTIELPQASAHAHTLNCAWRKNRFMISRAQADSASVSNNYYLMAQSRGEVVYLMPWNDPERFFTFAPEQFPAGVVQFLLLDEQLNTLSERAVFIKNSNLPTLRFTTDKAAYETRDSITAQINVSHNDTPLKGNLSVSITDDRDIRYDPTAESILTSLLLCSELKGHIEAPGYYFEKEDAARTLALDYLMMIHGWKRYNVPEVIKGNIEQPKIAAEMSQTLSGRVKNLFFSKAIENSQITVICSAGGFELLKTNEEGEFFVTGFEQPDSTSFIVQSLGKRGGSRVELIMNEKQYPVAKHIPHRREATDSLETLDKAFVEKAEQRAKYDEQMRVIQLDEVEIVAQAPKKENDALPWYSSSADTSVKREDIEKRSASDIMQLLYGIPGVMVTGNSITIRGAASFMGSNSPAIFIDGVMISGEDPVTILQSISVHDVEQIDVFKGASAAIFGMNGGNGVISIATRRGEVNLEKSINFNIKTVVPLGYQKPAEFYVPQYDTHQKRFGSRPDFRTTIFWKPDVVTDEDGNASFSFYTADFQTTYTVIIEGISDDGEIVRSVEKIAVKYD
ncbi:TonB-dependent receptor plug domain-containing protein [Bacteroides sp. OttesenSCG-928-M17]|nr:TonB-dependent receptor plug domain-containing protein [Bacteroides sp. OttesenSCG-928-M17]